MTGENFKFLNRGNSDIQNLKNELQKAKVIFTDYANDTENKKWNWTELYKLEDNVKKLEHQLYCVEYEANRKRNWK